MTNSALKGIKCIINLTILTLSFTTACIPLAFQGLPVPINETPFSNSRAELCNLLSKVGLGDEIQTCLNATRITDAQRAALCSASAQLSEADKNLLKANLPVDVINSCAILVAPSALATPTGVTSATGTPTSVATETTTEPNPSGNPTALPAVTNQPLPTPTATTGTAGGGSNGGFGGGTNSGPQPTSLNVNVVVSDGPVLPITASGSSPQPE